MSTSEAVAYAVALKDGRHEDRTHREKYQSAAILTLATAHEELTRQRDALILRVRELENRANLIAGTAQHQPELRGQYRAAVFILTGKWPGGAGA